MGMRGFAVGSWRAAWMCGVLLLSACASLRPAAPPPALPASSWLQRIDALRATRDWEFAGRAAVAVDTQGWQANLNWRQRDQSSELHLSGPLGVGAMVLRLDGDALSLDGGPAGPQTLAAVQQRLGFDAPLAQLRYWLLGIPDPSSPYVVTVNSADRAHHLEQSGWSVDYDRYMPNRGDTLPAHLVLRRDRVRVRIIIDQWSLSP